ncbi:serine/threonine-protein kinase [Streptomyces sp. PsTaAH-124]|uniref:serine/threonine-protein kinase n=1 Tax=Streptomyces sp. PsTaAH-124 TaxID=1157638 RepID=UPI0003656DAC|nr:serine/threonine-protein kinase [Streptomyces sp. PsTaAH-124]
MEKLAPGDPREIGAYRLLARLGAGGMGQVYLARSGRGRTAAVKVVRQELAQQEEFRARFRQEVRAARRVGGNWTAPVLDADTEAAVPWVATGYVAGPSLQRVVGHDHGPLPERSVRVLAAGLAEALRDIHAAGLVHRDLKPSNVLVTIDGPRVIDFGIARALETVADGGLTRTGALLGSPGFMAPEQVRGDRITPACDIFCLGSVLAYAATGTLPFGTADSGVHALMYRIAQEEPDLDALPEGIADLVRACLRKDPAARPALEEILERTGAEDTVCDGRLRDPWLPGALVAQLGRHAVRLLDAENPEAPPPPATPPGATGPTAPALLTAPAPLTGPAGPAAPEGLPQHDSASSFSRPHREQPSGHTPAHTPGPAPETTPWPSPEHATAVRPPAPGAPAGQGHAPPDHPPTQADRPAPAPASVPTQQAYGHPQHPHPHQHPQPHPYRSADPPYFAPAPDPAPDGPRRGGPSTVALLAVALVVALGAGGSVYALMQGGGHEDNRGGPGPSPTATASGTGGPDPSPTGTGAPPGPSDGVVPTGYLGTWRSAIDSELGSNPRRLTIAQGGVGDRVLTLVADGPTATGGTYHCVFEARLVRRPDAGGPLELGPSTVRDGTGGACNPGAATQVLLLPQGGLQRVSKDGGERLTYTKE